MTAGQALDAFWEATPREFAAAIAGARRREEAARDQALLSGWTAAYLGRVKDFPDLADVLAWFGKGEPEKPMSNDELIRSMRSWVVVTGGTLADPELAAAAGVGVTPNGEGE